MKTGATLHGTANLAFDAADAVTHIVEGMYRNIAATPLPLGTAPQGSAPGIAGLVLDSVRKISGVTRGSVGWALSRLSSELDRTLLPGPHREAAISALNGICGDHLARRGNALAIPMQLRVLLPESPSGEETPAKAIPFADLFEVNKRAVEIYPRPMALQEKDFVPSSRPLILLHGLSMSDREWTSRQHNHGEALAEHSGYTPIYALYNTGRNVSTNGRELCNQLTELLNAWPVPIESVTFIGFSMGGLLARSAMQFAAEEKQAWLDKVDKAVYIGTPHHGAVMERGGYWLQKSLTYSPYTAPLAALGRIRSAGITDLRHGNVRDEDWQHHDEHDDHTDRRQPTPLPEGIKHFAIAATLSKRSGDLSGKLLGDGLVHPSSATGRHRDQSFHLPFPDGHTKILYGLGHLAMLHDSRVLEQLTQWLGRGTAAEV
ncbi:Uncharacterised protein [Halioglobus japonicus]|nr:Uncharacterised protein [Halioglobus japonicus]